MHSVNHITTIKACLVNTASVHHTLISNNACACSLPTPLQTAPFEAEGGRGSRGPNAYINEPIKLHFRALVWLAETDGCWRTFTLNDTTDLWIQHWPRGGGWCSFIYLYLSRLIVNVIVWEVCFTNKQRRDEESPFFISKASQFQLGCYGNLHEDTKSSYDRPNSLVEKGDKKQQ